MDQITLTYKVNEGMEELIILGKEFVDINKNICKLIYADKGEDEEDFHELISSFDLNDLNQPWFKEGELKINSWIDLIFGYKQWSHKPKRQDLNLFGKYCYNQYIKFDKILEKFHKKNYDEKTIIKKIETKKSRIINFGQCPEVLFNKPQEKNILPQFEIGDEKTDDMDDLSKGKIQNTFSLDDYEKKTSKSYHIVNFWVTGKDNNNLNNDYIYYLAFEEKKKC